MRTVRRLLLVLFVVGLIATLVVAAWAIIAPADMRRSEPAGGTGAAALVVSCLAFALAALSALVPVVRGQFDNTFALAKRWDEVPMLEAREIFRRHLQDLPGFRRRLKEHDRDAERAIVHLINFYWNISAALEAEWADPTYLHNRFSPSLVTFYPAIHDYLEDESGRFSRAAIHSLCARWKLDPVKILEDSAAKMEDG